MAQVFVVRTDLLNETPDKRVTVYAAYPNAMVLSLEFHGPDKTLLFLADNLIIDDRDNFKKVLASNWRDDYKPVVNAEANRRINLVFPEYKQRNYTAQYQIYITQYGADTTTWPSDAKAFKVEYDRGWLYIHDIRNASNSFTGMPIDPTDNSIWPPTITPIQ